MAAFLWTVYDHHLLHPGENPEMDVDRLIERLEAHLLGLRIAGVEGKRIAKERFEEFSEAGELFVIRMLEATSPLPLNQLNLDQVRKYLTAKLPVADT